MYFGEVIMEQNNDKPEFKTMLLKIDPELQKLIACIKAKEGFNRRDEALLWIIKQYAESDEAKRLLEIFN